MKQVIVPDDADNDNEENDRVKIAYTGTGILVESEHPNSVDEKLTNLLSDIE
ncbi:MAG: hypothetical protein ACKPFF_30980 [Planktothrix sp.]